MAHTSLRASPEAHALFDDIADCPSSNAQIGVVAKCACKVCIVGLPASHVLLIWLLFRYGSTLWQKYIERHEVSPEVLEVVVDNTYFDKQSTGLPYVGTLYSAAMAHSEAMRANPMGYTERFLLPKLNRYWISE